VVAPEPNFRRIERLPPYVFNIVNELKAAARARGEDIIDFGMGNPDQPTPQHIVDKLVEAPAPRYASLLGLPRHPAAAPGHHPLVQGPLRRELDPDSEAIVTIGSKEGLAHLALATMGAGDTVLVPNPAYPIHPYGFIIAGADVRHVRMTPEVDFFEELQRGHLDSWPRPKMLVLNFPGNPTTECVELTFFEKVVEIAREHGIWVVHDLAYADIVFDGYKAPSILQVPAPRTSRWSSSPCPRATTCPAGASASCAATRTWSRRWRASRATWTTAPSRRSRSRRSMRWSPRSSASPRSATCTRAAAMCLCDGLNDAGWPVERPKATMFVWAKIPEPISAD
jgi:alanine-synthesizing transaminase